MQSVYDALLFKDVSPLFRTGASRSLTPSDLPKLQYYNTAEYNAARIFAAWDAACRKRKRPGLLIVLLQVCGWPLLCAAPLELAHALLSLAVPMLLQSMIRWMDGQGTFLVGILYVAAIFVLRFVATCICYPQQFQLAIRTGLRAETCTMLLIARKALRMPAGVRATGEHVSLLSMDATHIGLELFKYSHFLWSGPFQSVLAAAMLYSLVGKAAYAAFLAMALTSLVMFFIVTKESELFTAMYELSDLRLRSITGALDVLRQAKMGAWEHVLAKAIRAKRNDQMRLLRRSCSWAAFAYALWDAAPAIVGVLTFTLAAFLKGSPPLTTDVVFPALAILEALKVPLSMLPICAAIATQSVVSLKRLSRFLHEEDCSGRVQDLRLTGPHNDGVVAGGFLSWHKHHTDSDNSEHDEHLNDFGPTSDTPLISSSSSEPRHYDAILDTTNDRHSNSLQPCVPLPSSAVLRHIFLQFPTGKLAIVRGPVGAGKSTRETVPTLHSAVPKYFFSFSLWLCHD